MGLGIAVISLSAAWAATLSAHTSANATSQRAGAEDEAGFSETDMHSHSGLLLSYLGRCFCWHASPWELNRWPCTLVIECRIRCHDVVKSRPCGTEEVESEPVQSVGASLLGVPGAFRICLYTEAGFVLLLRAHCSARVDSSAMSRV